ncbi:MAG: STAS/SEC14 domain-containing protein [Anaerolineales bacterium]|nr:STAS/SEC14 domain-containing protein [Chloroflexota bacterium]MBL6982872.1 STAS/SEC14 domain-containing protein [Anaerolineales bacterium]
MEHNKREFKGNTISWIENETILRITGMDQPDAHTVKWILTTIGEISKEFEQQVELLIDMSQVTKPTLEARKILGELREHPDIRKFAYVGASIILRTLINLISKAIGRNNVRQFATEKEALRWLKDD